MPGQDNERFKRDLISGSRLQYLQKMKHFYESQFEQLSRKLGEETEYGVIVTEQVLSRVEERLTHFEQEEAELPKIFRKNVLSSEKVTA